jgi:hypothetical protein
MADFDSDKRRRRFMAEARRGKKRSERRAQVFDFKSIKERRRVERLLAAQEATA